MLFSRPFCAHLHAMRGRGHWGERGGFGPGGFGEGHGHGHGGRRRMFDGGELKVLLLELVEAEPRHGYDLIRAIEELTGGAYAPSPGVVYPTLTLLKDMGHVRELESEGARKLYAITDEGKAQLAESRGLVERLRARLGELAQARERTDAMPVRRAMNNLRTALMDKLSAGVSRETMLAIVALVDEAAQKIERL